MPDKALRWDSAVVALLFAYFAFRLCFFAVQISPVVPPDEITHLQRVQAYSQVLFIPGDDPKMDLTGPITRAPYLYYLVMGKLQQLNASPATDLVFLRLMNACLALTTVFFGYRWVMLLTGNRIAQVFFVALLTNTPMFSITSASVSYDNLTNLLAAMSFFYLFRFFEKRNFGALMAFAACLLAGFLTKSSFLPLGAALVLVLAARAWRPPPSARLGWIADLSSIRPRRLALLSLVAALLVANFELYGGNLLHYQKLIPAADQIVGLKRAMSHHIFARNYITQKFRDGEVSFERAMKQTQGIGRPGARADAQRMLKAARGHAATGNPRIGPGQYSLVWVQSVVREILGIAGHIKMFKPTRFMLPYHLFFGIAALVFMLKIRFRDDKGYLASTWAPVLIYALVLMWLVNYPTYLETGVIKMGLQGRYLFPVLVPIWGLLAYYLITFLPRWAQGSMAVVASGYFVFGDLPYFLWRATDRWFGLAGQ